MSVEVSDLFILDEGAAAAAKDEDFARHIPINHNLGLLACAYVEIVLASGQDSVSDQITDDFLGGACQQCLLRAVGEQRPQRQLLGFCLLPLLPLLCRAGKDFSEELLACCFEVDR